MPTRTGDVLITGATGLLGSALFRQLASSGREPVGVSRGLQLDLRGGSWHAADLADTESLTRLLDHLRPACIVHCAALTDVDWCESHPQETRHFNVAVTECIATWAGANQARLIYISTDSVFDGTIGNYTENDDPAPLNYYARSKLDGESHALRVAGSLVARVNFYGWNAGGRIRLCEWALQRLRLGEPVPGFRDVSISPLCAPGLAARLAHLIDTPLSGVLHLGSADGVTKYELLRLFAAALGFNAATVVPSASSSVAFAAVRPLDTTLRSARLVEAGLDPAPTARQEMEEFTRSGVPSLIRTIPIHGGSHT